MPARGPDENLRPLNLIEPTGPSRDRELFTGVARWNDSSSIGERKRGEGGLGRVFDGGGTDYEQIIFHFSWFRMRYLFR